MGVQLHKEHHLRTAGRIRDLQRRKKTSGEGLINGRAESSGEDEDRNNLCSNQMKDKGRAFLREVDRATFKTNTGRLSVAKTVLLGSKHATPGEQTTKMIRRKIPLNDVPEALEENE